MKRRIKKGDVYKVDVGLLNNFSSNQKGLHPVVVMSNDANNRYCSHVGVVPFTHKKKKKYLPTHVSVPATAEYGLSEDSQFLGELYQPIDKEVLFDKNNSEYLGKIANTDLLEQFVNAIINHVS